MALKAPSKYTTSSRTEDRATLESDPSTDPGPGLAGQFISAARHSTTRKKNSQFWPEKR